MRHFFKKAAFAATMASVVAIAGFSYASTGLNASPPLSEEDPTEFDYPGQGVQICFPSGNKGELIQKTGVKSFWTVSSDDVTRLVRDDIDLTVEISSAPGDLLRADYYPSSLAAAIYLDSADNRRILVEQARSMILDCRQKLKLKAPFGEAVPEMDTPLDRARPNLLAPYAR